MPLSPQKPSVAVDTPKVSSVSNTGAHVDEHQLSEGQTSLSSLSTTTTSETQQQNSLGSKSAWQVGASVPRDGDARNIGMMI